MINTTVPKPAIGAALLSLVVYVTAMPLLAGLPRDGIVPLIRPSEFLQLAVTAVAAAVAIAALIDGRRWELNIRSIEWWLLAVAFSASVMPLLWLAARSQPIGADEVLATFPFVKYTALYFLVRCCVTSEQAVLTVIRATLAAASAIAVIAVTQALGVGPVVEFLGRFFVSGAEDLVDEGRGTTTIGSSIATGAYLAMSCGLALSYGLSTGARLWLVLAGFLGIGALASGQAGTVLALGVVVLAVAYMHRKTLLLISWGTPAAALGTIGLWPIVSARLADFDPNRGLPGSWVIRWNNISELYLPSLSGRGWLLGVSPDAILAPPDVWRDAIYLESGYLWLLWVGGLPLFCAVTGFLIVAWRSLNPAASHSDSKSNTGESSVPQSSNVFTAVAIAARAAVIMIALVSIIDPHLTLRAGADLFFILLALGMASQPLVQPLRHLPTHWRLLLADDGYQGKERQTDAEQPSYATARMQLAETPESLRPTRSLAMLGIEPEAVLDLTVRHDADTIASASLALVRTNAGLQATLLRPVEGVDELARGLAWRAIVLSAKSLRLASLTDAEHENTAPRDGSPATFTRAELRAAAQLAKHLEAERERNQPAVFRPTRNLDPGTEQPLPALRFTNAGPIPKWKRAIDLAVGSVALVATAPLWLISGLLVKRSGDGPILYKQVRIGTGGLPFQIYKFRTMYVDNDDTAHRLQNRLELRGEAGAAKDEADPRITPVGRRLRRTSLDELPQLINILRSEMSLVGPRPSLLWESELFPPAARRRLAARPGLTGLWQTNGRADVSMAEMLDLDLDYVDRMSPLLDVQCIAKTATSVVTGDGAR
ncbi:MAG: sugar transferase [Acidimicrobiales bacterium]